MGLFERAKTVIGGGDDEIDLDDGLSDEEQLEFEDEVDESIEGGGEGEYEDPDDEEEEMMEWDSAYRFSEWYLEEYGFADMTDFGEKAIMYKLERSSMYRDRIETGLETLGAIRNAKEDLQKIRGNETKESDYGQIADKVEDADRLISGIRSLSGEDEMMVQQGMGIAREALSAIADRSGGTTGSVDTGTEVVDESIDG